MSDSKKEWPKEICELIARLRLQAATTHETDMAKLVETVVLHLFQPDFGPNIRHVQEIIVNELGSGPEKLEACVLQQNHARLRGLDEEHQRELDLLEQEAPGIQELSRHQTELKHLLHTHQQLKRFLADITGSVEGVNVRSERDEQHSYRR